jgi:anti-sigma B factor antagonist
MSTNPSKFFATEREADTLIASPIRGMGSLAGPEFIEDRTALIEEIRHPDVRCVVVDFSNVDYFGSLLLDTLCMAWKHARERGAGMALCNLSPAGQEILQKSKLNMLWPVYPTREQAVNGLRAAASAPAQLGAGAAKSPAPTWTDMSSRLQVLETGPVVVIGFGGRDLPPEHALGRYLGELGELIDSTGCRELAFEMQGINMIPSGFLGVIASVAKRGVAISVRHPSTDVREVLELTHFDRIIKIDPPE